MARSSEYNFDGLVGPTHNYGGLSPGNVRPRAHGGEASNPREAALQGLEKMRFVSGLGVGQAVLPPQPRPSLRTLRALGFTGSDEEVLARAAREAEHLLRLCSSAAAMWTANAATHAPSRTPATDGCTSPWRTSRRCSTGCSRRTRPTRCCGAIFADERRFAVHAPLPGGGHFADEGAANHTRLAVEGRPAVHLFAWGRATIPGSRTERHRPRHREPQYPARQTLEASRGAGAAAPAPPRRRRSSRSRIRQASTPARSTPTCWRWETTRS